MVKLMVIGLDGATFDILTPYINKGRLPNLGRLIKNGAAGNITSTIPIATPASWSTIITGKNPGKHGVNEFLTRKDNGYEIVPVNSTFRQGKDVWEILSEYGKRVCVINVPFTYPPRKVNGFMISGFPRPLNVSDLTYPSHLLQELEEKIEFRSCHIKEVMRAGREEIYLQDLFSNTEMIAKATLYLLENYDWDFFMTVFYETDQIEHGFWKYIDPTHPEYNTKNAEKFRDSVLQYFERIDQIIGEMLKSTCMSKETQVIVVSDHGMRALHRWVHVNTLLIEMGYLKIKRNLMSRIRFFLFKFGLTPLLLYKKLVAFHLGKLRRSAGPPGQMHDILKRLFLSLDDIDWSRTKAYAVPGFGQVFINLRSRDLLGSVEPTEYEMIREKLIEKLSRFKDPKTSEQIFQRVIKKEEIYSGHNLHRIGDILLLPRSPYGVFPNYEFGSNSVISPVVETSGAHAMNGIIIMDGNLIKKGSRITEINVMDITPTILYLLGLPIPSDIDGKVLTETIAPSYLMSNPIMHRQVTETRLVQRRAYSEKEKEEIEEKLRRLGYL